MSSGLVGTVIVDEPKPSRWNPEIRVFGVSQRGYRDWPVGEILYSSQPDGWLLPGYNVAVFGRGFARSVYTRTVPGCSSMRAAIRAFLAQLAEA
jgi:hypothetical protein